MKSSDLEFSREKEQKITRRKRRNHSPAFSGYPVADKAKVAVAAVKGDKTLAELSEQFDVHANQIQDWKKQLLEGAEDVFGGYCQVKPRFGRLRS